MFVGFVADEFFLEGELDELLDLPYSSTFREDTFAVGFAILVKKIIIGKEKEILVEAISDIVE